MGREAVPRGVMKKKKKDSQLVPSSWFVSPSPASSSPQKPSSSLETVRELPRRGLCTAAASNVVKASSNNLSGDRDKGHIQKRNTRPFSSVSSPPVNHQRDASHHPREEEKNGRHSTTVHSKGEPQHGLSFLDRKKKVVRDPRPMGGRSPTDWIRGKEQLSGKKGSKKDNFRGRGDPDGERRLEVFGAEGDEEEEDDDDDDEGAFDGDSTEKKKFLNQAAVDAIREICGEELETSSSDNMTRELNGENFIIEDINTGSSPRKKWEKNRKRRRDEGDSLKKETGEKQDGEKERGETYEGDRQAKERKGIDKAQNKEDEKNLMTVRTEGKTFPDSATFSSGNGKQTAKGRNGGERLENGNPSVKSTEGKEEEEEEEDFHIHMMKGARPSREKSSREEESAGGTSAGSNFSPTSDRFRSGAPDRSYRQGGGRGSALLPRREEEESAGSGSSFFPSFCGRVLRVERFMGPAEVEGEPSDEETEEGRREKEKEELMRYAPKMLPFVGPRRRSTISVALPASIVDNAQTAELRAALVGHIARTLTVFGVDEVVIYEDVAAAVASSSQGGSDGHHSKALSFFVRNLRYLETPQFLRRALFPMHQDLRFAGLQNPLDAPHHVRRSEWLPYREGVVVATAGSAKIARGEALSAGEKKKLEKDGGAWIDCGLPRKVWVSEKKLADNMRVTVRLDPSVRQLQRQQPRSSEDGGENDSRVPLMIGTAVSPDEPPRRAGLYWGYRVRVAQHFSEVFQGCPFSQDGRYDLTVGTSERGSVVGGNFTLPAYRHMLLVFGALQGLEAVLMDRQSNLPPTQDPSTLFGLYLNTCAFQRSRTIRAEEAVPITLSLLRPHILSNVPPKKT
ncbi:rna methyltransferase [Cystoisospora suis]|uniref:Rna methyltransferase n=1 Tax=Cystoisospora suis TaxID=483139 RepID=A0A2C6KNS6_9APIC|nr:rna methyltransferase [Cystoisospora suis]